VRFERLDDWLRWQESCHPVAIDLGLERVREVAQRLGLLPARAKVITVAGTNGKGTCVAALEQLLLAAGQTCGVYSSPHILHYRERIRLNGEFASEDDICRAFAAIDDARGDISLTYFEFGTLAALYLFNEANLPYWVLEVGLGGRLDATNIVDADIAVITSIALDHTEWLGPDRESIGREKAGICRPGIPLVCADFAPPFSVLETAAQLDCKLFRIDEHFGFRSSQQGTVFWLEDLQSAPVPVNLPCPSLAAALQVGFLLNLFSELPVTAFEQIVLPGRLQYVNAGRRHVILDVAHNPAAFTYLARQLQRRHPGEKFVVVVAMMADKDLQDALAAFAEIVASWHLTTIPGFARAASTAQLRQALPNDVPAAEYASVADALTAVLHSDSLTPVLVTGSFYTVADATRFLQHRETAIETVG
jgi:folylpolyglutamate synthase/dihydrofolate synthase